MLQLKHIRKEYVTGSLKQEALRDVSVSLRDNEFVAVLGPSGSGKTTLLNIIGGLDRYDAGSMVINGISTDKYTDRDWDSYRNHSIGFVFQSYNLIAHQTILSNVELSLTIAGISRAERRARAKKALEEVGLGDQMHKRPNQLSGGQMQRVAIARALVNDPDILLADEPTGALDSETGIMVMELLKQVAADRLVVMVTHNEELANGYATRIISLKDGLIIGDSDPYRPQEEQGTPEHKNMGRARMNFLTALSLSFNNLCTKKGRTFLTAFAGSIGIIGIALILSLSNGVNNYINNLQRDTMASYPITLTAQTFDVSAMIEAREDDEARAEHGNDKVYSDKRIWEMASRMLGGFTHNNLSAFKEYLDDSNSEIHQYLGENGVVYDYDTRYRLYAYDPSGVLVTSVTSSGNTVSISSMMNMSYSNYAEPISTQMLPGKDGSLISSVVTDNYELVYGEWPTAYDEVVLVLSSRNETRYAVLGDLGFVPNDEYRRLRGEVLSGRPVSPPDYALEYADITAHRLYLLPMAAFYTETGNGTFRDVSEDPLKVRQLVETEAIELKICGIIRPIDGSNYTGINRPIAYTQALTNEIIARTDAAPVVVAQKANPSVNVLNSIPFAQSGTDTAYSQSEKAEAARACIAALSTEDKEALGKQFVETLSESYPIDTVSMSQYGLDNYASILDMMMKAPGEQTETMLAMIYDRFLSGGSCEENLATFGVVSLSAPSTISLYTDTFDAKDGISACIEKYNAGKSDEDKVIYTDIVGLLTSSLTDMVKAISYVLIAFVAVSLIVSSIMIGVITFISVLERTKEIGILRALGASKRNVSQVFNAETFIIGLLAGVIGILVSLLLLIPINAIIHHLAGNVPISASIPLGGAIALIVISTLLTLISGLIPSRKAAKRDPVTALRTE